MRLPCHRKEDLAAGQAVGEGRKGSCARQQKGEAIADTAKRRCSARQKAAKYPSQARQKYKIRCLLTRISHVLARPPMTYKPPSNDDDLSLEGGWAHNIPWRTGNPRTVTSATCRTVVCRRCEGGSRLGVAWRPARLRGRRGEGCRPESCGSLRLSSRAPSAPW